jgi:predicted ArsR family transcriptional regulator
MIPALVTEKEAAAMLRISRNKVKRHLPRVKLSAHGVRYDVADIARLIETKKEQHPQWTH